MTHLCAVVTAALILLSAGTARGAAGQQPAASAAAAVDSTRAPVQPAWGAVRIAKWSLAAVSGGAAIYGFVHNRRADERYERLEQVCVVTPDRCEATLPGGAYADPALEAEYQAIRDMDRRAGAALIAGQIGVAASAVLFILDLRNRKAPENIPFEPRTLDVAPARDGGLSLRMTFRLPATTDARR